MVEPVFQVLGAPTRVESSEEGERGGKVAADMNRSAGGAKSVLRSSAVTS